MTNIYVSRTAAQLPPATTKPIDDFGHAIRNAHSALISGPLDHEIVFLEKASRLVKDAHDIPGVGNAVADRDRFVPRALVEALER
jgi:hypothetical protein